MTHENVQDSFRSLNTGWRQAPIGVRLGKESIELNRLPYGDCIGKERWEVTDCGVLRQPTWVIGHGRRRAEGGQSLLQVLLFRFGGTPFLSRVTRTFETSIR